MYFILVLFMAFSPSLEASIVITVPPNVHVPTIKNPFPFYQEETTSGEEVEKIIIEKWLKKRAPSKIHPQVIDRAEIEDIKNDIMKINSAQVEERKIEHVMKKAIMKKVVSVCSKAVADTKENAVARVLKCFLQGFDTPKEYS